MHVPPNSNASSSVNQATCQKNRSSPLAVGTTMRFQRSCVSSASFRGDMAKLHLSSDLQNKLSLRRRLFPHASPFPACQEGTMRLAAATCVCHFGTRPVGHTLARRREDAIGGILALRRPPSPTSAQRRERGPPRRRRASFFFLPPPLAYTCTLAYARVRASAGE